MKVMNNAERCYWYANLERYSLDGQAKLKIANHSFLDYSKIRYGNNFWQVAVGDAKLVDGDWLLLTPQYLG